MTSDMLVLLVDDDEIKRYSIAYALQTAGYEVCEAANGRQALDIAQSCKPGLIILDINLPDISGFEVCGRIRSDPDLASIIIVQLSADHVSVQDRLYGLREGADAYLTQPVESTELLITIHSLMRLKRAEENVHRLTLENEKRLRQLADVMPQMVWSRTPEGKFTFFSRRCYEFFGLEPGDDIEAIWAVSVHPDDREDVLRHREYCLVNKQNYEAEYRLRRPDGKYAWILSRAQPVYDETGAVTQWYGTSTDISVSAEREAFMRSLLDSSPDCIKVLDEEGRILSMNRAGLSIMEIDDFSVCAMQPWTSFWKDDIPQVALDAFRQVKAGGTVVFEAFCETARGTPKFWEIILTPVTDAREASTRFLMILRDITERHRTAQDLQHALDAAREARDIAEIANQAKTDFLANMSHEIRTPLNVVIGLSTILARSDNLTVKQKEFVSTLQGSANVLLGLINDLLDISKVEAGTLDIEDIAFSLYDLLDDLLKTMSPSAETKSLVLVGDIAALKDLDFMGDPARLRQILFNLLSNAIKFTEQGGIQLVAEKVRSDLASNLYDVAVTVKDSGIGIPVSAQAAIFEKFTQADVSVNRKFGGTGLGLAISKTLVEAMGGVITLESAPGQGSAFTIRIPLILAAGHRPAVEQSDLKASPRRTARILLVDDYAPNILVASTIIEYLGYQVDAVSSAHGAIDRIETGVYQTVLMDVQMPDMDGFEATRIIRYAEKNSARHRIPIIGMTAYALTGDREKCLAAGMDDYLAKPFRIEDLAALLDKFAV